VTENILIEFNSNTEGIKTAEAAVKQLDKTTADQFAKTNADLKKSDDQWRAVASGVNRYVENVKNAGKAATGAFGTKALSDFDNTLTKVGKSIETLRAKALVKQDLLVKETDIKKIAQYNKEIDDLNKEIQLLSNAGKKGFDELGNPIEQGTNKVIALKTQLRQMKAELATIEDTGSQQFIELASQAAQLEDKIGDVNQQVKLLSSDTSSLDAGIEGVQGLAGAFAAAQGAMALFGAENDEVQKALLKVNAAMSIMQGLQQVGALLDKNSALNIFLLKTLRLQQAASTTAVAVSDGEAAVGAEALAVADTEAAVAQEALNTAMAANPAGILILALGVIVGLVEIFIGDTEKAAKAQDLLNLSMQEGIKTNNEFIDGIKQARDVRKADLEASNASAAALRENDIKGLQEQLTQTKAFEDSKTQAYENAANRRREILASGKVDSEKELEELNKTVDSFEGLQRQRFALEDQLQVAQINDEGEALKERLKNHTAFVEASVLKTREGSRAELVAQIQAIRARKQEELQSQAHLPGEIAQIRAQADREAQKVRQDIRLFDIAQEKFVVDANLQKAKEGSAAELNYKISLLELQKRAEIEKADGNAKQVFDIRAKYAKDEYELRKTYNQKAQDDALSASIAATNSQISQLTVQGADATNQQLLLAKEKLIEQQAEQERIGVDRSIDTAGNKIARLQAINDKELADKVELERQKSAAEISSTESFNGALLQLEANRAQRTIDNVHSSAAERKKAEKDVYDYQLQLITNSLDADKARLDQNLITQQEYDTKELEAIDKQEALKLQKAQQGAADRQAIEQASVALLTTLASGYFDSLKQGYQDDIEKVNELKDKKLISEKEADKRLRLIKRNQAIADREQALFNIAITTAQNIVKDHLNPVLIALDIGTGIAQAALVLGKKLPQLFKGTKSAKEGIYRTGELGPELMWHKNYTRILGKRGEEVNYVPEGAQVFTHVETEKILKQMPQMALPQFDLPTMPALPEWAAQTVSQAPAAIDYDKLGKAVAKHVGKIEDMPSYEWNVDNDGLAQSVISRNQTTKFLNRKYSFRK
jgi:hypothetical protein